MSAAHGLTRYKAHRDSCRCAQCQAANAAAQRHRARMIAYGQWRPYADPAGTRRRLQALMRNGWSFGLLASRLGFNRQVLWRRLAGWTRVTERTAAQVAALYDELWDQAPPERTRHEKRAATMARQYARDHGFPPALAWDDDEGPHFIDDPAATPAPGWDREPVRPPAPVAAGLIRDARKRKGLSQRKLAAVLGVSKQAVWYWEAGRRTPEPESWVQLELALGPLGVVRDPRPDAGDSHQREGEAA